MYRLLVVDDEPNIVDGLVMQIQDYFCEELMVLSAYSGTKALEILNQAEIDVVLSDISMPEMNGLEFMEQISRFWPQCKVLFLSGYDDFHYIQRASNNPCFGGYLLKSQSDETILQTIRNLLMSVETEKRNERQRIAQMKQIQQLQPLLQRLFLEEAVRGHMSFDGQTDQLKKMVSLNIDMDQRVLPVVGQFDLGGRNEAIMRMILAMKVNQALLVKAGSKFVFDSIMLDPGQCVWLFQTGHAISELAPDRAKQLLRAILLSIQEQLREQEQLPLSLAINSEWLPIGQIKPAVDWLTVLLRGLDEDMRGMMIIGDDLIGQYLDEQLPNISFSQYEKLILQIEAAITQGDLDAYEEAFQALVVADRDVLPIDSEQLARLLIALLATAREPALAKEAVKGLSLKEVPLPCSQMSRQALLQRYRELGRNICLLRKDQSASSKKHLIKKINQYIESNIDDYALSLVKIADFCGFNPSYLSRFYKQMTGENLSAFISDKKIERAKDLIKNSTLKISDIARQVGFASTSHFSMFFRQKTGMTPKEYQNR